MSGNQLRPTYCDIALIINEQTIFTYRTFPIKGSPLISAPPLFLAPETLKKVVFTFKND